MLILLLLLATLSLLLAVESAPSETVGYFKVGTLQEDGSIVPITPGRWTPVSVPFELTLKTAWQVFGDQFGYEDNVVDPYDGWGATYYGEYGWFYSQDDSLMMRPGHFYWVERNLNNESFNFFVMGNVNPQPFTLEMKGQNFGGWTPFALNESVPISVYGLGIPNLVADFDNNVYDQIVDVSDGSGATYYGEYGWYDTVGNNDYSIKPSHGYYFFSNNADNYSWTYTPGARSIDTNIRTKTKLDVRSKR
jgi:hypothetical protein